MGKLASFTIAMLLLVGICLRGPIPTPAFAQEPMTPSLSPTSASLTPTATTTTQPTRQLTGVRAVISDTSVKDEIRILQRLSKELGFALDVVDYTFINDRGKWFDQNKQRTVDLFMVVGGETRSLFAEGRNPGIDKAGCQNLMDFVQQGGSAMGIDNAGTGLFPTTMTWIGLNAVEAAKGMAWAPLKHTTPGYMVQACGGEPLFKGTTTAPQETNLPYPRYRVVPIKMNTDHPIVKAANIPDTVFLTTVGAASLFPDKNQPMEEVAWFANGDAAIGIAQYGKGNVYLVSPHTDLTLENDHDHFVNAMSGQEADRMGVPPEKRRESIAVAEKEGDPDGSVPDLALMKSLLRDAASRATAQRVGDTATAAITPASTTTGTLTIPTPTSATPTPSSP